jgi:hypothetical protein
MGKGKLLEKEEKGQGAGSRGDLKRFATDERTFQTSCLLIKGIGKETGFFRKYLFTKPTIVRRNPVSGFGCVSPGQHKRIFQ